MTFDMAYRWTMLFLIGVYVGLSVVAFGCGRPREALTAALFAATTWTIFGMK